MTLNAMTVGICVAVLRLHSPLVKWCPPIGYSGCSLL